MSRFAVMTTQNWNKQSDTQYRGFAGQCIRAFKCWQSDRKLQILGTVQAGKSGEELGYIIGLPGIFKYWDRLSLKKRNRKMEQYMGLLTKWNIELVYFPPFQNILSPEVAKIFGRASFIVRDGYSLRIMTLMNCVEYLVSILKNELLNMEVGIWCADSEIGRLLTKKLMPHVNNMILGGHSSRELYRLADEIIKETGLACPVTTDLESCLSNKQFAVMTEPQDPALVDGASIFVYAGPLDWEYLKGIKSGNRSVCILSGWVKLPEALMANIKLSPWEELGVLDALLYMSNESYRTIGLLQEGSLRQVKEYNSWRETLKVSGFISMRGRVSYDLFRMRYFSRIWKRFGN